jgi:tRNA-binding protein
MSWLSSDSPEAFVVRVGVIVDAKTLSDAKRRGFLLRIDFGPGLGVMSSVALIGESYGSESLLGREVRAVVNLPPRRVAGAMSEALVLGFPDNDDRPVLAGNGAPPPGRTC